MKIIIDTFKMKMKRSKSTTQIKQRPNESKETWDAVILVWKVRTATSSFDKI